MHDYLCRWRLILNRTNQFITENGASNALGGAPFNVAASIKRIGGHSSFIDALGKDELGQFLIKKAYL